MVVLSASWVARILEQWLESLPQTTRGRIRPEGPIVEPAHRPDAHSGVRQEYLIGVAQISRIQKVFGCRKSYSVCFAQNDASHHAGNPTEIHAGRTYSRSILNKHVAHGSRHQLAGAAEQ